jgi:hypothetical protein
MASFKLTNNKKIKFNRKSSITLDTKHKEIVNEFSKDENSMVIYKKELIDLKHKLADNPDMIIEEKLDITDRIVELKQFIKSMSLKKKNYFLENSKYIFKYFENKQNISTGIPPKQSNAKSKLINSFFKIKDEPTVPIKDDNGNIVLKYLTNVSDDFIDINNYVYQTDVCQICHKGEMIPLEEDGMLICNLCSRSIPYLIENEKPSYKDPPKEVCFYAYRRINHFKEILAQFQGKETTHIPQEVIENIKLQIKKERLSISEINNQTIKDILKKLNYNKHYEHIPFIKNKLGIPPPIMSPELEATLINLFNEIQAPYSKHCPDERVNFLHSHYTLYKLCELLNEKQYLPDITMLKDDDKRNEQDIIWKKICKELDWVFIPTL